MSEKKEASGPVSLVETAIVCLYCGGTVMVHPSLTGQKFCGPECEAKHGQCSIGECTSAAMSRGWCTLHYNRWQYSGDPLKGNGRSKKCPPDCTCKKHHGNRRVNKVPTTCLHCGKVIYRLPCHSDKKFCNRKCSAQYQGKNRVDRIGVRQCQLCNTDYESDQRSQKYCSNTCKDEARKLASRAWKTCTGCGVKYWRHKGKADSSKYCTDECKQQTRRARAAERSALARSNGNIATCPEDLRANMLLDQGCVCAICGRPGPKGTRLAADHCHETGVWRGVLCMACNTGLGMFKDDPDLLMAAAFYLAKGVNLLEIQGI